ncbi:hypothetical protein [Butyricicoccus pullicaecorum]|uniref:hypothetical protein n=1 Tax=Butyricicoccus pullicaecorum TaxID=501571 RepID=UPI0035200B2F
MLEADGFSIHTFEISKKLTKSEWNYCKGKLYDQSKVFSKGCVYKESKGVHRVSRYEANGLRITLEHAHDQENSRGYYVRMIINPRKVIDPNASYIGIFPPEKSSIIELQAAFHTLLKSSAFNDQLDDYYLSRVDLCVNIRCDHKKIFREVVRVLRKLPTPPKYKRVSRKEKDKKKANKYNKHYIKFQCGTHSLVIYDKTYQATEQGLRVDYEDLSGGVLRFEVQYQRSVLRGLEKKLGTDDPSELLWYLMRKSEKRISKHFEQCFADVQFCQIEEIEKRIVGSKYEDGTKQIMLELTHRMQRKQSVDQVLEEMRSEGFAVDDLLRKVHRLGFSPIPLWKNFCAQQIPGPVSLLRMISEGEVVIPYQKMK